ncbi:MAG: hypothetical protein FJ039_02180 [Chloroflexi bacterium]|nr:hypothetical protein [Chloroflexota bacterium]
MQWREGLSEAETMLRAYCRAKARLARAEAAYNAAFEAALEAFRKERRELFEELLSARGALEEAERKMEPQVAQMEAAGRSERT